jgi:ubiquinone/menaquinone biosynthesis C-methylase UbiE
MSANYQGGRALSSEAASTWSSIVAPFVHRGANNRILDLGAGTGRFAALFARAFEAQIVGIEPSTAMLAVANGEAKVSNLAYAAGYAEDIPLRDQSCDLAWLSHVWHHIRDHQACARELHRVVSLGGQVLVRGTFGDLLDGFPTLFHFWPATKQICQQLPTVQQTVAVFEANGFVLAEHRHVQQATAVSLAAFAERTRLRADTALALISDAEFREGQAAIEVAVAHDRAPSPVIEGIELLVFRESSNPNATQRASERAGRAPDRHVRR